jgi:hypothetical protein
MGLHAGRRMLKDRYLEAGGLILGECGLNDVVPKGWGIKSVKFAQ